MLVCYDSLFKNHSYNYVYQNISKYNKLAVSPVLVTIDMRQRARKQSLLAALDGSIDDRIPLNNRPVIFRGTMVLVPGYEVY